jgi:hypothetical protein
MALVEFLFDTATSETAQNTFLQAQKISTEAGALFVFVYVPTKFRVYKEFCDLPEDSYGVQWQPNDLPSKLETWSTNMGIPYLDLTGHIREGLSRRTALFSG